ncbi:hypothetical protein KI387_021978, partial [Taxus chinensis]
MSIRIGIIIKPAMTGMTEGLKGLVKGDEDIEVDMEDEAEVEEGVNSLEELAIHVAHLTIIGTNARRIFPVHFVERGIVMKSAQTCMSIS